MKPLVSVNTITYNQAPFIHGCIEGVLMQKTNFAYELVIGEDCSTDGTREIVQEYAKKNPEIIRVITSESNVGIIKNAIRTSLACRGKYIALCEGDDYWTDPLKLQKQVDFLETHPKYPICFHPVIWREEKTGKMRKTYYGAPGVKDFYTLDDLLERSNFLPTASVVFRNFSIKELPAWFSQVPIGDIAAHVINLYNSSSERIGFIDEPMAVYRRHRGGTHGGNTLIKNRLALIQTYLLLGKNLNLEKRTAWQKGISKLYVDLCRGYQAEGDGVHALRAGYSAVHYSPRGSRSEPARQVLAILVPLFNRPLHLTHKAVLQLREEGPRTLARTILRWFREPNQKTRIRNSTRANEEALAQELKKQASQKPGEALNYSIERSIAYTTGLAGSKPGIYCYASRFKEGNLYASVYAAMLRHLTGDLNGLSNYERSAWCDYLNEHQRVDGLFWDPTLQNEIAEIEDWWGWRHLSAHVITALTVLNAKPRYRFAFLDFLYGPGKAERWIANLPWQEKPLYASNTVMNYGVLLQYERDFQANQASSAALEEIFAFLNRTQCPETGLWGNSTLNSPKALSISVQTAYHLLNLYFYDKRTIQYMERAIDSCLDTQNRLGGFGAALNSNACEDIDSIDPLSRFYFLTDYRRKDIRNSLDKALPWVLTNRMTDGGFVFSRFMRFAYGHDLMTTGTEESNLFATWFRTLSIAYISQIVDFSESLGHIWQWVHCPGYQYWHGEN